MLEEMEEREKIEKIMEERFQHPRLYNTFWVGPYGILVPSCVRFVRAPPVFFEKIQDKSNDLEVFPENRFVSIDGYYKLENGVYTQIPIYYKGVYIDMTTKDYYEDFEYKQRYREKFTFHSHGDAFWFYDFPDVLPFDLSEDEMDMHSFWIGPWDVLVPSTIDVVISETALGYFDISNNFYTSNDNGKTLTMDNQCQEKKIEDENNSAQCEDAYIKLFTSPGTSSIFNFYDIQKVDYYMKMLDTK